MSFEKLIKKIACLFCIFFVSINVLASETVVWLTDTASLNDNFENNHHISISTDTTRLLLNLTVDFKYDFQVNSLSRISRLMKSKHTTFCMSGRIKTAEREVYSTFSQPVHLYPKIHLYYTQKNHPINEKLLDADGYLISLEKFFEHESPKKLTIAAARSYGNNVDKMIEKLPKKYINYRAGLEQHKAIATMLLKDRIDYTFAYPTWFYEHIFKDQQNNNKTYSIPIDKGEPYILGRVQCNNTVLGKKVIKSVNTTLDKMYLDKTFYQLHTFFLLENDRLQFKKNFQHVFINRNF